MLAIGRRPERWRDSRNGSCPTEAGELMSISYGDNSVATLRTLVATIERELASAAPAVELRDAWSSLVDTLALGPPPELRTCPTCQHVGMRAATRCMHCWSQLPLLPSTAAPAGS
jgi:hypothetical protein